MTGLADRRAWQGIETCEPPQLRFAFEDLAAMAEKMLADRRRGFPALVEAGDMTDDDAQREIAAFEDLVADWRFIASGASQGEPGNPATVPERRRLLDASLSRIAALARRQRGFSETLGRQAECVIALRWHLEPGRDTVALARLTAKLRADAQARRTEKEPALCH